MPQPSRRPIRLATATTLALSLLVTVGATWATLLAWLINGMRCDDGCTSRATEPGRGWRSYRDGWQYDAQLTAALIALACAAAAMRFAWRGRVRPSLACTAVSALAFAYRLALLGHG
jgi:FtsH-binding integral membrane protein